tara:strand:+ start:132 stop:500 length:369 start_codon:yes stop_codon:yes gene_type:complete
MFERRAQDRRRCQLKVTSACGGIEGRAVNISESGLYLQSRGSEVLKVGERYDLRIALAGRHIEVQAEIVESRSELFHEAGSARFTKMSTPARASLRNFTDSLERRGGDSKLARIQLVRRPAP